MKDSDLKDVYPYSDNDQKDFLSRKRSYIEDMISLEFSLGIHTEKAETLIQDYDGDEDLEVNGTDLESYLEENNLNTEVESYVSGLGLENRLEPVEISGNTASFNDQISEEGFRGIDIEFYRSPDPGEAFENNIEKITVRYTGNSEWPHENLDLDSPRPHRRSTNLDKKGDWKAVYTL